MVEETNRNLTPSRGPSVWGRQGWHGDDPTAAHRVWLGMAGAGLVLAAWRWSSTTAAVAGAGLLALSAVEEGPSRAGAWVKRQVGRRNRDRVTSDSALSFPASDSPGWTATDSSYPG
jgi:hypothetical protein